MKWREIGSYLRELWHRPAGPMNWKNPIRVFAVAGWLVVQVFVLLGWAGWRVFQGLMLLGWTVFRVVQFVLALPALLLFFFGGLWYAVWSFVRRPFPSLDENPILALVEYHTPNFFDVLVIWYYLSPFVAVMLSGFLAVTVWKVWLEGRRRDFAPFAKLPPWPLDPKQKAPAIVIGEVHHPVEAREIFSPSWLTIPERGLYTGVAIFGAVGSGKTSACMNPFARQLLGWQAGNLQMRAAALVLEVKGDFCHDIRQILVEAGRGQDYIELGMDARSQWNPLSAWWLDSYSLAYTVSSLLNQLFGKGKEPFWKSSIVEGVLVFLSMFDMPDVAKVFCPAAPHITDDPQAIILQAQIKRLKAEKDAAEKAEPEPEAGPDHKTPQAAEAAWVVTEAEPDDNTPDPSTESNQAPTEEEASVTRHLPPIYELIEQGKVLALNMPAGINPALSRAVGVMLKNAWLQALLMRPAKMKANPGSYFRSAVFICDEYQAFASVGEDDPSGDEKSFALTRQCRCIPIVATQSISSLRAVLGSSEAWRSLLQTLRTRIFLSLSDDASAKIASELCGQVAKIKESYTISETSKRSEVSPLSGRAGGGGGSMGATKSFREQREAVFHPRDFALLGNCQAICLPYDGAQSLEPRRVYVKPHYLPAEHSYWRAKEAGQI